MLISFWVSVQKYYKTQKQTLKKLGIFSIKELGILGGAMFKGKSSKESAERLLEEHIYAQVVEELSRGLKRDGLWAKALVHSHGEEQKAKALYIRYRVQSIFDEMVVTDAERRQKEEIEADKKRAIEKALNSNIAAKSNKEWVSTVKNFILFIGVVMAPYIFAWFTLQKGYKISTRIFSFLWLALIVWLIFSGF